MRISDWSSDVCSSDLEIAQAVETLAVHDAQRRPLESRHPLALRRPQAPTPPEPRWDQAGAPPDCAMHALDRWFVRLVDANPALRVRVGNPDELRSNHMGAALERLRPRVNVRSETHVCTHVTNEQ